MPVDNRQKQTTNCRQKTLNGDELEVDRKLRAQTVVNSNR